MTTEIKAKLNHLRVSPRKVRLLVDLIRDMDAREAESQLRFASKRASNSLLRLLNSAIANAKNDFNLEKDVLYIKKITVNEGPPFKRWKAKSRGRAAPILKRTSHINLVLGVKEGAKVEPSVAKAVEGKKPAEVPAKMEEKKEETKERVKPKVKPRAPKKISKKPSFKGLAKKVFRRKSF